MNEITIKDEFIKLGQFLKLAGISQSGLDAKMLIVNGKITVNGEAEARRGRKLFDNDEVGYDGISYKVKSLMKGQL